MQHFPSEQTFPHKNILVALPSYASIAQLSSALVLSTLSNSSNIPEPKRLATLISSHVTPIVAPSEDEKSIHTALELYELNNEWLVFMVRGLVTQRRRFMEELVQWMRSTLNVENVYTVAGGNAVYRERGFQEEDPMGEAFWRELHEPKVHDTDMSQQEEEDFLRGDVYYFVEEMRKWREEQSTASPKLNLLMRLCNEGENRMDAHLTAARVLRTWLGVENASLVEPKAWACMYGTRGSNLLYY